MSESNASIIYKNSALTLFNQLAHIVLGFFIRKLFIDTLGVQYLGYDSVFNNILQVLNLADLGIGVAITGYLYGPIARKDKAHIAALMYIYKKMYHYIGFGILMLGIVVSIFLPYIIPDAECEYYYIRLFFYINLAGVVSSYFLSYQRTLMIADQKAYYTAFVDCGIYIVISLFQIYILFYIPNYIYYLVLAIAKNVISNIIIYYQSLKMYYYLRIQIDASLVEFYKESVYRYVKDVFISRVGAIIYFNTDNIIISVVQGSLWAGYLANYTMITNLVSNSIMQVLGSIQATFGNYINLHSNVQDRIEVTDDYLYFHAFVGIVSMVCTLYLVQPFISFYLGADFLLDDLTVILLAVNLMMSVLIQLPSQLFTVYKLFKYDKYIIIISASLNIIISVMLSYYIGINGVLIGTLLTSLFYLFSRLYIVSRKIYRVSIWHYVVIVLKCTLIALITTLLMYKLCIYINFNSIYEFIIWTIYVLFLSLMLLSAQMINIKALDNIYSKIMPKYLLPYYKKIMLVFLCGLVLINFIYW